MTASTQHAEGVPDILVIDDDELAIQLVSDVLDTEGFNVSGALSAKAGLEHVARCRPQIVLLDLVLPDGSGMDVLEQILTMDPGIDVMLFTGNYSTESAVEAIQKGAYDYLTKPLRVDRLRHKLAKWREDAEKRLQTLRLDAELLRAFQFEGIVGRSPSMLDVFSRIRRIAPHFQTALVTGETGTGKELVAKALHQASPFSSGPFIVCNCAAVSENLFESELFGHVRGAFTGATNDKQGFAEAASGGTLFLDEVTEIPLGAQAKLLRLLQNREIQRVGSPRSRPVDLRIVAATNRDLRAMVAENRLREDLYYRLAMVEVKLPRLMDRQEDLLLLQRHFLEVFSARYRKPRLNLTRRAQESLAAYSWPGNIREMENVLGFCCMMSERDTIDVRDLPEQIQRADRGSSDVELLSMDQVERQHAMRVLERVNGNRVQAAEILGISRATLYRLIAKNNQKQDMTRPSSQLRRA